MRLKQGWQERAQAEFEAEQAIAAAQVSQPEVAPAPTVEPPASSETLPDPPQEVDISEALGLPPLPQAGPAPVQVSVPAGWVPVRNRETGVSGRAAMSPDQKMVMLESEDGPPIALPFADFWSRFAHHACGSPVQPSDFPAAGPGVFQRQQTPGAPSLAPGTQPKVSLGQALAGSLLGMLSSPRTKDDMQSAIKELDARAYRWRQNQVVKSDEAVGQILDQVGNRLSALSSDRDVRDLASQIRTLRETAGAEEQHLAARAQMQENAQVQGFFQDLEMLREVTDDNLKKAASAGMDLESRHQELQSVIQDMENHPLADVLEDQNGNSLRESFRKFMEAISELFNRLFSQQDQESQATPR